VTGVEKEVEVEEAGSRRRWREAGDNRRKSKEEGEILPRFNSC